jgi:pimeloyl-ACP methyl ester carboxylesterase
MNPGGIVRDNLSFALRALPLSLLGEWGVRRIARLVLAGQAVPSEVEQTMTLILAQFKTHIGVLPIFTDDELRRLTMPVQVLLGQRDRLRNPQKIAARTRRLIPHAAVTIVPEAGHALVNARPYVLSFLNTLPPN